MTILITPKGDHEMKAQVLCIIRPHHSQIFLPKISSKCEHSTLLCINQTRHDQIFSPKIRIKGEHSRYGNIFIPSYDKSDLMNSIMLLIILEDVHETKSTVSWIKQTCHGQNLSPKICNRGEHSIFDNRFVFMIQRNGNSSDLMTSIMLLITPEGVMVQTKCTISCIIQTRHCRIFSPKICNRGEHSRYNDQFNSRSNKPGNSSDLLNSIVLLINL